MREMRTVPDPVSRPDVPVYDTEPTPIPVPSKVPAIAIVSRTENIVRIRLYDPAEFNSRRKPLGVDGAAVFSFVGEVAPTHRCRLALRREHDAHAGGWVVPPARSRRGARCG